MSEFHEGQRVLYIDVQNPKNPNAPHMASMANGEYMLLNAKDENGNILPISGRILLIFTHIDGNECCDLAPDGWITSASGWPRGFQTPTKLIQPYDGPDRPGTITNGMGKPIKRS